MTNAMPPLQMMIKLSYGWRPLPLPRTQMYKFANNVRRNRKIAAIAPYIVYNFVSTSAVGGRKRAIARS